MLILKSSRKVIEITYPIAFVAGVLSFFAPCLVPLLPVYVAYVTGISLSEVRQYGVRHYRTTLLLSSIAYILGFSLIFVLLGATVGGVGGLLRQYDFLIHRLGGILLIVFGLQFAGIITIPAILREYSFLGKLGGKWVSGVGYLKPFVIGVIFGASWTPCVGVVLGSILTLAIVEGRAADGAALLFAYSLGISIPFLLVALTLASAQAYLKLISYRIAQVSRIMGFVLVIMGLLLLTDTYKFVNAWFFEIAFKLGYTVR